MATQNYFRSTLLLILVIIFGILFSGLGFWQLGRYVEKKYFIITLKKNLGSEPKSFHELSDDELFLSKIKVKGHFLNHDIHLYGRIYDKQHGYYLVSPFITENRKVILVARGWFHYKDKNTLEIINSNEEEIVGIVLHGEKPRIFVPNNDIKKNVWFTLDLKQASALFSTNLENYYIIQIHNTENINGDLIKYIKPINTFNLLQIKNDHLEYAATWFSFAVVLAVGYIIFKRTKKIQ